MEASNGLIKEVLSGFSCEEFLSVSISDCSVLRTEWLFVDAQTEQKIMNFLDLVGRKRKF